MKKWKSKLESINNDKTKTKTSGLTHIVVIVVTSVLFITYFMQISGKDQMEVSFAEFLYDLPRQPISDVQHPRAGVEVKTTLTTPKITTTTEVSTATSTSTKPTTTTTETTTTSETTTTTEETTTTTNLPTTTTTLTTPTTEGTTTPPTTSTTTTSTIEPSTSIPENTTGSVYLGQN